MRMPVFRLNSSAARWFSEPVPGTPTFSAPGFARASATSSFTERTGSDGCTTSTSGPDARLVTGSRSRDWS